MIYGQLRGNSETAKALPASYAIGSLIKAYRFTFAIGKRINTSCMQVARIYIFEYY